LALKDLYNSLDSDNFEIRNSGNMSINADLRPGYIMNSRITGVEDADVLLLVGSDLK
jgi:NADH dehydrogenase (ubiquinone) Fe-S protein 1